MILLVAALLWQHDWKTAFATAKEEHRLVAVAYTQTEARCKACYPFEQSLDGELVRARLSGFVVLRVDPDINRIPRAHRYAAPALVIFDWSEHERFRIDGEHVLRADDWHESWGERKNMSYPLFGPLGRFASETPAFVKAAELLDDKKDAEAYRVLAEAYERLHMTEHARAAAKLVKNFSSP